MGYQHLPKCGAHARSTGKPCQHCALANGRCYYHGGAASIKHGRYTKQAVKERKEARRLINNLRVSLKTFKQEAF